MRRSGKVAVSLACLLAACGGGATIDAGGMDAGGSVDATSVDAPVASDASDAGTVPDAPSSCSGASGDADGDGHRSAACGGDDCDDADATRYPGNPEVCDTMGRDEDCNPTTLGPDHDGDGFVSTSCCDTQDSGTLLCGSDCDDMSMDVSPAAPEVCDGVDDDCDAMIDEDVRTTFYRDLDGDTFGDPSMSLVRCAAPPGYVLVSGDCDDTRVGVHPGATETCNTFDDDCDGSTDPGCACTGTPTRACGTPDGASGFLMVGACHPGTQTCTGGVWDTCGGNVDPTAESCNGVDDDCNGTVDDGVRNTYYGDADADGYGVATTTMLACTVPAGYALFAGDCDDGLAPVHPGATEVCNARDDNCDGRVDEGVTTTYYRDTDGDGYGVTGMTMTGCATPSGYVTIAGDCNDGVASIHPAAGDACDGVDNDCDGIVDQGCMCTNGDTRPCGTSDGMGGLLTRGLCHPGTQTCTAGSWGSCAGNVNPTMETCNTLDEDCDGAADNGVILTCYRDNDADGYAPSGAAVVSMGCSCPSFTTPVSPVGANIDCDDGMNNVHPGAAEVCNRRDDDCSTGGGVDTAEDSDGDHFTAVGFTACSGGYPTTDCGDSSAAAHPGATGYGTTPFGSPPSYDYDCDGTETKRYAGYGSISCSAAGHPCASMGGSVGWDSFMPIPACGVVGRLQSGGCDSSAGCFPATSMTAQSCR